MELRGKEVFLTYEGPYHSCGVQILFEYSCPRCEGNLAIVTLRAPALDDGDNITTMYKARVACLRKCVLLCESGRHVEDALAAVAETWSMVVKDLDKYRREIVFASNIPDDYEPYRGTRDER